MATALKRETNRIADEIVSLVERTGGPVTLCRVHCEIAGFAKAEPPYRSIYRGGLLYWADMTDAGGQALDNVLYGNRVAVEIVDELPYVLEGGGLRDADWQPVVLLPASAANVSTKNGLFRLPEELLRPGQMLPSWKPIKPAAA
jgi:hypothetical protein